MLLLIFQKRLEKCAQLTFMIQLNKMERQQGSILTAAFFKRNLHTKVSVQSDKNHLAIQLGAVGNKVFFLFFQADIGSVVSPVTT